MIGLVSPPIAEQHDRWTRVTRRHPCPICEHGDWCLVSPDGTVACCMRVDYGAFKADTLSTGEHFYLHRLVESPVPLRPQPRPTPPPAPAFDTITARSVYGLVATTARAAWSPEAAEELARRFGPYAEQVRQRFDLGYGDERTILAALADAGRLPAARAAGVVDHGGRLVTSLRGRIVIPYVRDGQVLDLRGAGLKARGATQELSLPGGYAGQRGAG